MIEIFAFVNSISLDHFGAQTVGPGNDEFDQLLLDLLNADAWAFAVGRAHNDVHARQSRLGNLHR